MIMKCEYPGCEKEADGTIRLINPKVCWKHRGWTKGFTVNAEDWNKMAKESVSV